MKFPTGLIYTTLLEVLSVCDTVCNVSKVVSSGSNIPLETTSNVNAQVI
jgi:hypothetical protein